MKRVVVTGAAGFIGFHVARALVARGDRVVGTDNLSPYYDVGLKRARLPYSEHDAADHPVSLYAATKRANELLAHSYSHLFRIPLTGLRLFTVYGPWGRPDMAYYTFTDAILAGRPISLHMGGVLRRDFTFIDDVVEGVVRTMDRVPAPDPAWRTDAPDPALSSAPFRLYNIGNHTPVTVRTLVETLERHLGRRALIEVSPMQAGDVEATHARVDDLARDTGFAPTTTLDDGIRKFVAWYREYHGVAGA